MPDRSRDTALSMSRENVEFVRRANALWNAGNLDALREFYDPDIVLRGVGDWPEPGPFVGTEAVLRQWERLREAWDDVRATSTSDFVDHGDLIAVRFVLRGKGRGPEAEIEQTIVWTMHDGLINAIDFYWDHADALKAMGLSDHDAHAKSS
jgi:ketosteroid isomerase-like protein